MTNDLKPINTAQKLAKAIFKADVPEEYIRQIPAQSLYMAMKENGLESSAEIIEIATLEQCRLLLDFDVWEKDQFSEAQFWEWLALTDATNSLVIVQKLLKFVDLKLVALLIARYVDVKVLEEPTDEPPGPGSYTPDQGFTWIFINAEDSTQHFLL